MKSVKSGPRIERPNSTKNRVARNVAGLVLALVCVSDAISLPGYCGGQQEFDQSTPPAANAGWAFTGNLNTSRYGHTATLLASGKVLVAGGGGCDQSSPNIRICSAITLSSAELYDPNTGTWSYTGNLNVGRTRHTATLLSNGKVLVVGGEAGADQVTNTSELYDPATETWSSTGQTHCAGTGHTATLLANGKVLVAGSFGGIGSCNIAELYDPATGNWRTTGSLNTGRALHTATLLPSGKVLVAGGLELVDSLNSAELYDPGTETWSITGNFNTGRSYHSAILLPSGKVLVAGGEGHIGDASNPIRSAELYDSASGTWRVTGNLITARGRGQEAGQHQISSASARQPTSNIPSSGSHSRRTSRPLSSNTRSRPSARTIRVVRSAATLRTSRRSRRRRSASNR